MEFSEETQLQIESLANRISNLESLTYKNNFSNTTIVTKEISQLGGGYQSANFVTGSTGWRFDALGNLEAESGYFRGDITGASGTFSGTITATTGAIGGFDTGADYIRDVANSFGLASTVTGGDDVRFWAGATFVNRATAPLRITEAGAITGSNITITGGSVAVATLNGILAQSNLNIANMGWTQTCVFSASDLDTVAWAAGTLVTAGGTTYNIGAGNTGNMAARTFIYLDIAVSTTAYQVTTTATTAVGAGKVLVATAINGAVEPTWEVFGGIGGLNIPGTSIVAASITTSEIAANTIVAGNMNVGQLSAISADLGAITAGTIVLPNTGFIRGGQTDYNTGTGFFLGYSGDYKFSIGNPVGNYITWDGATLTIFGQYNKVPGTVLIASADTERGGAAVYTKIKEILINKGGTYTIKFDMKSDGGVNTVHGRVYKNGAEHGTDRTTTSAVYATYSENLLFAPTDLVQLYVKEDGGGPGSWKNFRMYTTDWESYSAIID